MNRAEADITKGELVRASDFSPEEERLLWADVEQRFPDIWRKCYPRIYESYKPNEYATPKTVARQMFGSVSKIEIGAIEESEKIEAMWCAFMARRRNPIYWVTRDIVDAIMKTTPPVKLDWYNMQLPYEAMAFMLPKGTLIHPVDGEIDFISFMRARKEDWVDNIARSGPRQLSSENGSFVLFAKNQRYFIHWNMPYEQFPVVDLREIEEALTRYKHHHHSTGWWLSTAKMTEEDTKLGIKAAHLLFGLLLLITRKPELVSGGLLANKIPAKKGKAPREFWSCPVIGRNYKIKRVPRVLGGTHASPRYHWVTGYWREQTHGPKNSLIKEIWVEPYERGLEDDSEK